MLTRWGRFVANHHWWVIAAWLLLAVASLATALVGVTGQSLFDRLHNSAPSVAGEAQTVNDVLSAGADDSSTSVQLVVHGVDLSDAAQASAAAEQTSALTADLAEVPGLGTVVDPLALPRQADGTPASGTESLFSSDGKGFIISVPVEFDDSGAAPQATLDHVVALLTQHADQLRNAFPNAQVEVGGSTLITDSMIQIAQSDLERGEIVTFPVALIAMLFIFGGFLAAGMPLIGAGAAIVLSLGALFTLSFAFDIDTTVMNVVSVIGLGLSIDYGLLIVSRYREEYQRLRGAAPLDNPRDVRLRAMSATLDTAGRTVMFSGLTFTIATAGLLLFEPSIMHTIAIGSISVVVLAILAGTTLIPALMSLAGERILKPGSMTRLPGVGRLVSRFGDVPPHEGVFSKLTRWVQRHAAIVTCAAIAALILLASPITALQIQSTDVDAVPRSSTQYDYVSLLRSDFPHLLTPEVILLSNGSETQATEWADSVSQIAGVTEVTTPVEVNEHWMSQVSVAKADGVDAVRAIRADRPAGFTTWVGGAAGETVDFADSLVGSMPWVVLVVGLAAILLLFLMTGSLVIPLKALVVSALSLGAAVGVLVWGFQEGHLSGLLNFDPDTVVGVDMITLVLVLVFGFGLAMDYEMFILSRVKEHFEAGSATKLAIVQGLQNSGRIITSAALIIVIVFIGFTTGDLLIVKEIGVALAVAVALDATIARCLLVPAVMSLMHRFLWWAPRWMKPFHDRFGFRESGGAELVSKP